MVSRWLRRLTTRSYTQVNRRSSGSRTHDRGVLAAGVAGGARVDLAEPVGDHRGALALEDQRRDPLGGDRVPDQPVGRLAEQHLAGGGDLLQAGGHVDGVAQDQGVADGRVAGDDLAGVDAGAGLQPVPPVALQLVVELVEASRSPAAARTARRASSSLATGMPNTATTASPTNFCTRPPWRSRIARRWSNQRAMTTASDSGSSRWPRPPDPARSVKTTVTVLRAGRLAAAVGSWEPQFRQKLALAGFGPADRADGHAGSSPAGSGPGQSRAGTTAGSWPSAGAGQLGQGGMVDPVGDGRDPAGGDGPQGRGPPAAVQQRHLPHHRPRSELGHGPRRSPPPAARRGESTARGRGRPGRPGWRPGAGATGAPSRA